VPPAQSGRQANDKYLRFDFDFDESSRDIWNFTPDYDWERD